MAYNKPSSINSLWAASGEKTSVPVAKRSAGWVAEKPSFQYFNQILYDLGLFDAYLNERGIPEWDDETEYQNGKSYTVGSDGNVYKCNSTHTNQDPTLDDGTHWVPILSEKSISEWNGNQSYLEDSIVLHDGDIWKATEDNSNVEPSSSDTEWDKVIFSSEYELREKTVTVNFSSDADVTLTDEQNSYGLIELTDTGSVLTAERELIVSDTERNITVTNSTDYDITVKTSAGTGVSVRAGYSFKLRCNGTDVELPFDHIVENGSNSNGSWTKYASGRMTQNGVISADPLSVTVSDSGVYFNDLTVTFPVSFDGDPILSGGAVSSSSGVVWSNLIPIDDTSCTARVISNVSATITVNVNWSAEGEW